MREDHPAQSLFFSVTDPEGPIQDWPALTTLLHRVCGNDHTKFDEGCRLIGLFMEAAYKKGQDSVTPIHNL